MKLLKAIKQDEHRDSAVVLFSNVRNERTRLPFFLDFHRSLGIEEFYIVDNGSTDGTVDFLLSQEDVAVYSTKSSFIGSRCGLDWLNEMRNEHGKNRWCLTLDCDELLVYPDCEKVSIQEFVNYLDNYGYRGLFTIMLDCYGKGPINSYEYKAGQDFLATCPYFDKTGYYVSNNSQFPYFGIFGGARYRAFYEQDNERQGPTLKKIPLVKWGSDLEYLSVTHSTTPIQLADLSGALLHFKYIDNFFEHVKTEVEREDRNMKDYQQYKATIDENPKLDLFCDQSRAYRDSTQLLEYGLITTSISYVDWTLTHGLNENQADSSDGEDIRAERKKQLGIGSISKQLSYQQFSHVWSNYTSRLTSRDEFSLTVVIPVFNAATTLSRAIESVLNQVEVTELLLIEDGSTDGSLEICEAYSRKHDWIRVLQHPEAVNLGAGPSRNLGIEKSLGEYIAFLDADDVFLPNRFRNHKSFLLQNEDIDGVYGCQGFEFSDEKLKEERAAKNLPMLTTVWKDLDPEDLFVNMNPIGRRGSFHCNTLTVRKEVFDKTGRFWDKRTEDVQMWMKMAYVAKLKGLDLRSPIANKFVHSGNRMNAETTKRHRPLVFASILEFAGQRKDEYEKTKRLIERYSGFTHGVVDASDDVVEREKIKEQYLVDVVSLLGERVPTYQHVLEKTGEQFDLYSKDELVQQTRRYFEEDLKESRGRISSIKTKNFPQMKKQLDHHFKALHALIGTDLENAQQAVLTELSLLVELLEGRTKKYKSLITKAGEALGFYSANEVDTATKMYFAQALAESRQDLARTEAESYQEMKPLLTSHMQLLSSATQQQPHIAAELVETQLTEIIGLLRSQIVEYLYLLKKLGVSEDLYSEEQVYELVSALCPEASSAVTKP